MMIPRVIMLVACGFRHTFRPAHNRIRLLRLWRAEMLVCDLVKGSRARSAQGFTQVEHLRILQGARVQVPGYKLICAVA